MANELVTDSSNVKNCAACGLPFTPEEDEDFCRYCKKGKVAKEADIIAYLREHPGVSILEVSAGLYLNKDFGYPCGHCGKLITFGTYCPECFEALKKDAKNAKNATFIAKAKQAKKSKEVAEARGSTFSTGMQDEIKTRIKK